MDSSVSECRQKYEGAILGLALTDPASIKKKYEDDREVFKKYTEGGGGPNPVTDIKYGSIEAVFDCLSKTIDSFVRSDQPFEAIDRDGAFCLFAQPAYREHSFDNWEMVLFCVYKSSESPEEFTYWYCFTYWVNEALRGRSKLEYLIRSLYD